MNLTEEMIKRLKSYDDIQLKELFNELSFDFVKLIAMAAQDYILRYYSQHEKRSSFGFPVLSYDSDDQNREVNRRIASEIRSEFNCKRVYE